MMRAGGAYGGGASVGHVLAALGDSHTYNATWLTLAEYYPATLAPRLGDTPLNLGVSGNSTAQAHARRKQMMRSGLPRVAVVYCGTNDFNTAPASAKVIASPAPTSTVFTIDQGASYYVAEGWITVAGESAQIASMSSSQITLTAALAGGAPATDAAVRIDTQKNIEKVVAYLKSAGIPAADIYVVGQHYLNFSSGGDTTSSQNATASSTRVAQAAAATAQGVNYVDTYAYMRALILAGDYVQGSASWHVAQGDSHLNAIGQNILSDCLYAAIT